MDDQVSTKCAECGTKGANLLRCSRCHDAWYCGPECQRNAWKNGHKKSCKSKTSEGQKVRENAVHEQPVDTETERKEKLMIETFNEARSEMEKGNGQEALDAFQNTLKKLKELATEIPQKIYGLKTIEAKCLRNIGSILIQSDRNQAKSYLEAALETIEELKSLPEDMRHPELQLDEAETYDHLGSLEMLQANYLKALVYYSKSLGITEKGQYGPGMVVSYGNLGLVLYQLNRYAQAQEMFNKQIFLAQTNPKYLKYLASGLNNSGIIDIHSDDVPSAIGKFVQALIYARTSGDKEQERTSLVNLINNNQDIDKASSYYESLRTIQQEVYKQDPQHHCFQCTGDLPSQLIHVVPQCLHFFHRDCWLGWRDSQAPESPDLCPKCTSDAVAAS